MPGTQPRPDLDEARAAADAVIDRFAATGYPFSANDLRPAFIDSAVPTPLRGSRLQHALRNRKVIEAVTDVRSSDKGTHGKRILLYRGTPAARS